MYAKISILRHIGAIGLMCVATSIQADQVVLSDDGREVRLFDDGSWEFVSEDRFATSKSGERFRLGADGRWDKADEDKGWVAIPREALDLSRDRIVEDALQVDLVSVTIESVRSSRHKNTQVVSQMLFEVALSSLESSEPLLLSPEQFKIRDSRGRAYPVRQISPARPVVAGGAARFTVVADGAPRWWGVKFFELEIESGSLGNAGLLLMTKSTAEVAEVERGDLTAFPPG